jgi:hypothetical protein
MLHNNLYGTWPKHRPPIAPSLAMGLLLVLGLCTVPSLAAPPDIVGPDLLPGDLAPLGSAGDDETPAIVRGENMALLVWADGRTNMFTTPPWPEEQSARDIYAARVDASGNLIDEIPIVINQDFGYQIRPRAAWNGSNWLVVWESQAPTQFYYASAILCARVAPDGTVLDPTPIEVVRYQNSSGAMYAVASNGSDWVVVAQGTSAGENNLIGVRIASNGSIVDTPPKVLVPAAYYLYFSINLFYADGEYLLTYDNLSDFRARRFTSSLTQVGNYVVPGLVLASSGTGYYIVWTSGTTIVGSPMTKAGVRTFPAGVPIAPASEIDGMALAWDGTRWWFNANEYTSGVTLRRIDANGSVIDPAGIPVDPASTQHALSLAVEGAPGGGALACWQDSRIGWFLPEDVHLGFVSTDGIPAAKGPMSQAAPSQLSADLIQGDDGFLIAMRSRVSGSDRIQVQRLSSGGHAIDAEPITLASGASLGAPAAAWNGSVYFVVWSDGSQIRGTRLSPDGTILDTPPILVMGRFSPDVAAVGSDFLVAGIDFANNNPEFQIPVARRVSGTGAVLDPVSLQLGSYFVRNPRVINCQGRWLVMWQRHSSHDNPPASLDGAFVEANGTKHPELGNVTAGFTPALAFSGTTVLIVYRTGTDAIETKDVRGLRMLPDGTFPDGTGGFVISALPDEQKNPTVAWDGTQFVTVWDDNRNAVKFFDQRTDLYGARVSETGTVIDASGFAIANAALPEQLPSIASRADGRSILAASLFRTGEPFASFRVGTYSIGELITGIGDRPPAAGISLVLPNPFYAGMSINYAVASAARVGLRIYDVRGALVAEPLKGVVRPAGVHQIAWDGTDTRGNRIARGVYFVRLEVGARNVTKRVVLLR